MSQPHLFSFGHGYSAQALATRLLPRGWRITGTTRNAEKAQEFDRIGIAPFLIGKDPIPEVFDGVTHLLISAGPDELGDPMLRDWAECLRKSAPRIEWVGYLSTTGVYGDHGGAWVDEATPLTPATKRGIARVKAEAEWQAFARELGLNLSIFRLAGIYGPGRGPFAKVRNGTARRIIKPNQIFSRIHVEDIAQVLEAAINRPKSSGIYNICDDLPVPPQEVIAYAAELLNLPIPPEEDFATAEMTPMARSFYAESKKVRNDKMKRELGVRLRYPDYKAGLKDLLNRERV